MGARSNTSRRLESSTDGLGRHCCRDATPRNVTVSDSTNCERLRVESSLLMTLRAGAVCLVYKHATGSEMREDSELMMPLHPEISENCDSKKILARQIVYGLGMSRRASSDSISEDILSDQNPDKRTVWMNTPTI